MTSWRSLAVQTASIAGIAALAAWLVSRYAGDDTIEFATSLALWIALAESWVVLSGYTGYVSLGHAAFVGAGAYAMVLCWGQVPFWLGLCLAAAVAGGLAAILGGPCLRVRGPYFVILTLGIAEFLKYLVIDIEAGLGRFGRLLLGAPDPTALFLVAATLAAAAYVLAHLVRHSRFGTGLRAIRENETCAEMTGVPVTRLKITAFVLSAIIPGAAGAILVSRTGYFEPAQIFSPQISLTIITVCIVGGSDGPAGPLLGAVFLQALSDSLSQSAPQLYLIILGVVLVLFVVAMPDGLVGRIIPPLQRLRARLRGRASGPVGGHPT